MNSETNNPVRSRAEKPTKQRAQAGAFGKRTTYDASKPLTPAEMAEKYKDVPPVLAARRKRRRRLAKKGRVV